MRWLLLLLMLALGACTDAGLYAAGAGGAGGPDRAEFKGKVCVPLAAGDSFPVKVVFAIQGGAGMDRNLIGEIVDALNEVVAQFSTPYITFAVVAHHSVATGLQGSFVKDQRLATAFAQYAAYQEAGPVSHRAALKLANSLISGDMQTECRGKVARARYYVVLIMATADTSCANPAFNAGISLACNNFPDDTRCTACELARVTEELKNTGRKYNAGEVTIQPVFVRSTTDCTGADCILTRFQAAAIAQAGGTELVETTPGNVKNTLTSLNYASLQRALKLKRLIAINRNAIARGGVLLPDSDGDGLPDEVEDGNGNGIVDDLTDTDGDGVPDSSAMETDPRMRDTDLDGIDDGVEVKMGLKPWVDIDPMTGNPTGANTDVIRACNYLDDTDGDRLNDCEERVLGTDACITDTDGDSLPELVELLANTNPLLPEDLKDDDRDGLPNVGEVTAHTDPVSADIAYQQERGYGYAVTEAEPTPDGRACYDVDIYNVSLVSTLERLSPDGTGVTIRKGTNDIYLYFQVGRDNDPRGTGIGSLFVQPIIFQPPNIKRPRGIINFTPEDFVSGY